MIKDKQVKELRVMANKENSMRIAAMKTGMCTNSARKYLESEQLPSQMKNPHTWRTRKDPFETVWESTIKPLIEDFPGLQAKTLFEYLQRENPGQFQDGQIRTLQRKIKYWRAIEGPNKEVYFPQIHYPGDLCASDFTSMNSLTITINGFQFDHLLYHFVLTYSNWEAGTICFSESFESLSQGLQNALWKLGKCGIRHRTDRLSAAFNNLSEKKEMTDRYRELLKHYGLKEEKTQPGHPNENGDVEQSNNRLKIAIDQALMLRGSRNFTSRQEYEQFLKNMFQLRNAGRKDKLKEELNQMRNLPSEKMNSDKIMDNVRVSHNSTIRVQKNIYSVFSRLIGEKVKVRLCMEHLEVWLGSKRVQTLPRLRGSGKFKINYRHIISSLVRKPGAFKNYKYKSELFPTTTFRIAYDLLLSQSPGVADKEYLKILNYAAMNSEEIVKKILDKMIQQEEKITSSKVEDRLVIDVIDITTADPHIDPVDLTIFDVLLSTQEAS